MAGAVYPSPLLRESAQVSCPGSTGSPTRRSSVHCDAGLTPSTLPFQESLPHGPGGKDEEDTPRWGQ